MLLKRLLGVLSLQLSRNRGHTLQKDMDLLYSGASQLYSGLSKTLTRLYHGGSVDNGHHKHFTVAVEGNIASGKTTLLKHFNTCPYADVYAEPVSKWRNVDGHNALGMMYSDPSRWSLTFQTYVQLTMLEQHTIKPMAPVKLMERSIYSAKYCFVENLHNSGKMADVEYTVLTKWFDWIVQNQDTHLDLIVYLRTTPDVVHERVKQRCRNEEMTIPLDYLTSLHELHEDWLIHRTKFSLHAPVLVLDANEDVIDMMEVYESHRKQILCGYS